MGKVNLVHRSRFACSRRTRLRWLKERRQSRWSQPVHNSVCSPRHESHVVGSRGVAPHRDVCGYSWTRLALLLGVKLTALRDPQGVSSRVVRGILLNAKKQSPRLGLLLFLFASTPQVAAKPVCSSWRDQRNERRARTNSRIVRVLLHPVTRNPALQLFAFLTSEEMQQFNCTLRTEGDQNSSSFVALFDVSLYSDEREVAVDKRARP